MEFEDDFFFEEDKILTNSLLSHSDAIAPNYLNGVKEDIITALIAVLRPSIELRQLTMMEDRMGMTITSGNVIIQKDSTNLIGISIGGGAPLCPCLYIVQVFDNTPAATEGTLQSGDELVAVNGASVKGKTKVEVAKMIQVCDGQVSINYNKLHADPRQGRSLDIALKKILSPLQSILWPLVQIAIDKDPSSAALLLNCPTKPVATAIFSALEICIRTNPKNAAVTFGISYE